MEGLQRRPPRRVTARAVGIGLLVGLLIAVVTPYNDYVVNNSFIVGSYFPPIIAVGIAAIVLLINAPLHRFAPRLALAPGELAVILAIGLMACALPSQGLFREFMPLPVAPFNQTGQNPEFRTLFEKMSLPSWLFAVKDIHTGDRERVVTAFYGRLQPGERLPWDQWVRPLIGWGVFAFGAMAALVSVAVLLRHQWTVNERLPFPIAQLELMLIAPPEPGRALNEVFRSKGFWIALLLVLTVESSSALHHYLPTQVPAIPFQYDFRSIFSDEPWSRLPGWLKSNTIYFTLLGLAYFTQTRVSFSLWGTAVLLAVMRWLIDPTAAYLPDAAFNDQQLGAAFAFIGGVIWIGRRQWKEIACSFIGRGKPARGEKTAAVVLACAIALMIAWLLVVGCSVGVTLIIVVMILMAHVITARVVAETGLAFVRVHVGMDQIITALPPSLMSTKSAYLYGASHYTYMQSARESATVFTMHGLNVVDAAEPSPPPRNIAGILSGTMAIAAIACVLASLWCYYHYAQSLDPTDTTGLINHYGVQNWPKTFLVDFPTQVQRGVYAAKAYNPWYQIGAGIVVMILLQAMTWRFTAWPFLPVGYLMCTSWYMYSAWLSIFLGWIAKVIILRVGGAKLFNDLKPVFIGLIFGEAMATALWLIVTLILAFSGREFYVVRFLPQ